jgi:alpha-glucoside transport system permease protein
VSGASVTAEPPPREAPPSAGSGKWGQYAIAAGFLAPAAFFLGIWIIYPTIKTIVRSFYGRDGSEFVGIDNYRTLFSSDTLVKAIENNAIWVIVVPAAVTALGLLYAVLTERVRWAVAFKTVVFLPIAVSAFAAGVTWRIMYQQEPDRGAINAGIGAVKGVFSPTGVLSEAAPSSDAIEQQPGGALQLAQPLEPGGVALLGLTRIRSEEVPETAKQAVAPESKPGAITGVVWRDFKPGGGTPGKVESEELGLPGVTVELLDQDGGKVQSATTADDGSFTFENVPDGSYTVGIGASTFAKPFGGVSWLGSKLITPSIIISYIWIWAGFAMVVIAAGLAAISRETLEAARTDGATEWQVFWRVTVPQLWPVLTVVFITLLINVLKVFDIVLAVAPQSVQDDANVIALAMWRTSFGGVSDFGLGSAIAVFLFLLVLPILAIQIRRFRKEQHA